MHAHTFSQDPAYRKSHTHTHKLTHTNSHARTKTQDHMHATTKHNVIVHAHGASSGHEAARTSLQRGGGCALRAR